MKGKSRKKPREKTTKKTQAQKASRNGDETVEVVVFKLSDYEHAVALRYVQEIMMYQRVEPIAEAPDFVEGVVKLRGDTIPVLNLHQRIHLPRAARKLSACLVIIRAGDYLAGLVVDSVVELLHVPLEAVEEPNELTGGIHKDYITGIVYIEQRLLVLLDIRKILQIEAETWDGLLATVPSENPVEAARSGIEKIVSFRLSSEWYGVGIDKVSEILRLDFIMPIPNVQDFIIGIINLRGSIVPVIDLAVKFRLKRMSCRSPAVVVCETGQLKVGFIVDGIPQLLRLPEEAFQQIPASFTGIEANLCSAICRLDDAILVVLDVDKILADTRRG